MDKKKAKNIKEPEKKKEITVTIAPKGMMVKAKTFIVSLFKKQL